MRHIRLLMSIAALTLLASAGCSTVGSPASSEVEVGQDPIRDACSQALRSANAEPSLPALTQCEVQVDGSRRIFVLQFADYNENIFEENLGSSMDALFYQPLNALRSTWALALNDGGIDQYIVAFQDECQTVYELSPDLVEGFVSRELPVEELTDRMEITGFSWC